jgi:putative ABC transport system permease protein
MLVLRMALRELWRIRGRLGLLAVIIALQIMTTGGAYVMTNSFTESRDAYYERLHFADLSVGFVAAADTEMPSLESLRAIPGVSAVARRYVTRGTVESGEEPGKDVPFPVTVIYLDPGPQDVNDIAVLRGNALDPSNPNGAIVDATFAENRHLSVGSPIVVNPHRFATRFTVAGVGMSPEYLAPVVDPRFFLPAKGSMGILYAPRKKLDELFVDRLYNELLFRIAPGADEDAVRARVVHALAKLELEEVVPRRSNLGYRMHEELLRTPRVIAPILSFVVGFLGAIVAYVLMMRIVQSQRREIGALLAMGFPSSQFVAAYLLVGLIPSVVGAVGGVGLAPIFGRFNAFAQARVVGTAEPTLAVPWSTLALAASFALIVTLGGVLIPLTNILRMTPAHAMRGGNEVTFRPLPPMLDALVARARATTRYAVRNIARRRRLSGAAVLLLGAGISAPAALLSLNSSWALWSEELAGGIPWDATVNFRVPLEKDHLVSLVSTPGLHEVETFVQGRATLARDGVLEQDVRVRGLGVPSHLDPSALTAGRDLSSRDALEVILNEGVARDERPVRVGEKVRLSSPRGNVVEVEVVGLVHDASVSTIHMPIVTAQRLLGLGEKVTGMLVVYGPMSERAAPPPVLPDAGTRPEDVEVIDFGSDPSALAPTRAETPPATPEAALLREEMVVGLQSRTGAAATTERLVREERTTIIPYLVMGMCFSVAAVLSVLAILFLEREGEYATLRSMGYGVAAVARIVFTEVAALAALGLVAAVVAWIGLDAYILHVVSKALFPLPVALRLADLVAIALPTLGALAIASAVAVFAIQRIDLRAALTTGSIG